MHETLLNPPLAPEAQAQALRQMGCGFQSLPQVLAMYGPLLAAQPRDGVVCSPDLAYGEDPRHRLDLYRPEGEPPAAGWPVLVVLHGGGFVRGDKSQRANFGWHFARQGWLTVVPNYRLAPAHTWPCGPQDVAAVWRWLHAQAAHRRLALDPGRIVLLGESAGAAHVAAAALLRRFQPPGWHIAAAVLLSGPYDALLERQARAALGIPTPDPRNDAYFGTDEPQSLQAVRLGAQADAAPLPVLIGVAERELPQMQVQAGALFTQLATRPGFAPAWLMVRDHNHFSQCCAVGTGDVSLAQPLQAFLDGLGRSRA